MGVTDDQKRYYVADLEEILQVKRSTIITWDRNRWLPEDCVPSRDSNDWRYWSASQVEKIKQWRSPEERAKRRESNRGRK